LRTAGEQVRRIELVVGERSGNCKAPGRPPRTAGAIFELRVGNQVPANEKTALPSRHGCCAPTRRGQATDEVLRIQSAPTRSRRTCRRFPFQAPEACDHPDFRCGNRSAGRSMPFDVVNGQRVPRFYFAPSGAAEFCSTRRSRREGSSTIRPASHIRIERGRALAAPALRRARGASGRSDVVHVCTCRPFTTRAARPETAAGLRRFSASPDAGAFCPDSAAVPPDRGQLSEACHAWPLGRARACRPGRFAAGCSERRGADRRLVIRALDRAYRVANYLRHGARRLRVAIGPGSRRGGQAHGPAANAPKRDSARRSERSSLGWDRPWSGRGRSASASGKRPVQRFPANTTSR